MDLSSLRPAPGAVKERKRIARGTGSGTGKTAGRGHKGKGSRSGGNTPPGYEGGQMPLRRRLPKRGFRPMGKVNFQLVTLEHLAAFPAGATIQIADLIARGFVRRGTSPVKCLADGALTHAVTLHVHAYSQKARAAIEAVGGTAQVLTSGRSEVASA